MNNNIKKRNVDKILDNKYNISDIDFEIIDNKTLTGDPVDHERARTIMGDTSHARDPENYVNSQNLLLLLDEIVDNSEFKFMRSNKYTREQMVKYFIYCFLLLEQEIKFYSYADITVAICEYVNANIEITINELPIFIKEKIMRELNVDRKFFDKIDVITLF